METRAGDPGAFADFDLARVPSPAFVVDAAKVRANLSVLRHIGDASGARVLAALKAFSMWSLGPTVALYADGVCASGLYEAKLGREEYGGPTAKGSRDLLRGLQGSRPSRNRAPFRSSDLQFAGPDRALSSTARKPARCW